MWKKDVVDGKQDWPYSQYGEVNGVVSLSGQTALKDGVLIEGGIVEQTRQAIANVMAIVHRLEMDERNITKVEVVLLDIDGDREGFEDVYDNELFPDSTK